MKNRKEKEITGLTGAATAKSSNRRKGRGSLHYDSRNRGKGNGAGKSKKGRGSHKKKNTLGRALGGISRAPNSEGTKPQICPDERDAQEIKKE